MTKKEISNRVLKNGTPLEESLFQWDADKNHFKTNEPYLTIDFSDIHDISAELSDASTIVTWKYGNIKCGQMCTVLCGPGSQISCGKDCNIDTGVDTKIKAELGTIIISRDSVAFAKIVTNTGEEIIDESSVGTDIIVPYYISENAISNEPVEFTTKIKISGKLIEVTSDQLSKINEIIKQKL